MPEPAYAFTLPSLADDIVLDCRIYHPPGFLDSQTHGNSQVIRGAVFGHPYAAMGGSYDDPVVLAVVKTLVRLGWVVGTFNFRGAPSSAGHTSWTGHAEQEDFASVAGFMVYYTQHLSRHTITATSSLSSSSQLLDSNSESNSPQPLLESLPLLLGGYSYGGLVLARLPPVEAIIARFQAAELGTAGAEIVLRARTLARETLRPLEAEAEAVAAALSSSDSPQTPPPNRGRKLQDENRDGALLSPVAAETPGRSSMHRVRASPVTVGGEETDARDRHLRSREVSARRSFDGLVRRSVELPKRIAKGGQHVRSLSGQHHHHLSWHHKSRSHGKDDNEGGEESASRPFTPPKSKSTGALPQVMAENLPANGGGQKDAPRLSVRYLFISPVLLPFSHTLCTPGASFLAPSPTSYFQKQPSEDQSGGQQYQQVTHQGKAESTHFLHNRPTLAIFGSMDGFTAAKRLRVWAERQAKESSSYSSSSSSSSAFVSTEESPMAERSGESGKKPRFEWTMIETAGHFWREEDVMKKLRDRITEWEFS